MYNQNWHVVLGPRKVPADITETQLTDPWMVVLRMKGESTDPGPEIVIYVFAEQPEGRDGIVVTTQAGYEIREDNRDRDVNDADYEYESSEEEYDSIEVADVAAQQLARSYADNAGKFFDWTGDSPMIRTGGPVT